MIMTLSRVLGTFVNVHRTLAKQNVSLVNVLECSDPNVPRMFLRMLRRFYFLLPFATFLKHVMFLNAHITYLNVAGIFRAFNEYSTNKNLEYF